jgi:hypothetical protein
MLDISDWCEVCLFKTTQIDFFYTDILQYNNNITANSISNLLKFSYLQQI